jgi:hypothetical protein
MIASAARKFFGISVESASLGRAPRRVSTVSKSVAEDRYLGQQRQASS